MSLVEDHDLPNRRMILLDTVVAYEGMDHLEKCLEWGLKLKSSAGCALKISLYGHDIERAFNDRAEKKNFINYSEYKKQHSLNSANYLMDYLKKIDSQETLIKEVDTLVRYHDIGYVTGLEQELYKDLRILRDADAITLFDDRQAIEHYIRVNGIDNAEAKMRFMFRKLSQRARSRPEITDIYKQAIQKVREERKKSSIDDFL